jgi:hypothetical protein
MRWIFVSFALSVWSSAAADELSAGELYSFCTSRDQAMATACYFYILGAVQGVGLGDGAVMGLDRQMRPRKQTHFCIPESMPTAQMVTIFEDMVSLVAK